MDGLYGEEEQKKEIDEIKRREKLEGALFNMIKNGAICDQKVEYMDQAIFTEEDIESMRADARTMANGWHEYHNTMLKKTEVNVNAGPPEVPFVYKADDILEGIRHGGRKVEVVEFKPFTVNK